eukprot:gene29314-36487_t
MTRMYPWCHRVSSRRRRRTEHRHQTSRRLFLKDGAEGGVVACATAAQEMIRKFGEHIGMENASAERGPAAPPSAEDAAAAQPRGADRKDTVSERVKSLDAKGAPKLAKILNHVQLQNSFFPSLPTHVPGKNARLLTVHERDSSAAGSLGSIGMANSLPGGMQHGSLSRRMRSSLDGSMPLRSSLDSPARSSLESHPQRSSLDSPSRRSNEERAQSQLDWPAPGSPAVSDELKSGASQSQSQLPRAATISAPASIPQGSFLTIAALLHKRFVFNSMETLLLLYSMSCALPAVGSVVLSFHQVLTSVRMGLFVTGTLGSRFFLAALGLREVAVCYWGLHSTDTQRAHIALCALATVFPVTIVLVIEGNGYWKEYDVHKDADTWDLYQQPQRIASTLVLCCSFIATFFSIYLLRQWKLQKQAALALLSLQM